MKSVGFILVIFLYMYACYLAIRGYFFVASYLHQKFHNNVARSALLYAWFLAFAAVEVPFGIFFPAWVSEKWKIFAREPTTTTLLILFGCASLALAAWRGWRSVEARRFSEMLRD